MPPGAALMEEVIEQQKLRALYLLPSFTELVLHESNGVDLLRSLDLLCYTGGPFSQKAKGFGPNHLAHTNVLLYGSIPNALTRSTRPSERLRLHRVNSRVQDGNAALR